MNELLEPALGTGLATALFVSVVVYIVIHVLSVNYTGLRRHIPPPDLLPGEQHLDELHVHQALSSARMTLTDRRVVVQRLHWPFTGISQSGVALGDLHGVSWSSGLSIVLFILAAAALAYVRPVGLLVLMLAMEVKVGSVRMLASLASRPFSRPGIMLMGRAHLPDLHRFYRTAQVAWASVRAAHSGTTYSTPTDNAPFAGNTGIGGFTWGRSVWTATMLIMFGALLQRLLTEAVSYDHLVFTPLFLGIPVGVACRSTRDGAWAALLSVLAVFAVKFPMDQLSQGQGFPLQLLLVLVGVVTMAVLAGLIAQRVLPVAGVATLAAWPAVVALDGTTRALDLRVVAMTLLAMAVAAFVASVGPPREPRRPSASQEPTPN